MDDRWEKVRLIFGEAIDLPLCDRRAFLERACAGEPELLGEVASLLTSHDTSDAFLSPLPQEFFAAAPVSPESDGRIGMRLGPYQIVSLIAHGGMGEVYEAQRVDGAFDKRVAVKLVRWGISRKDILDRFEVERKTLASLQHPNIAQLIDAGTTDDGVPYLVMEFVGGTSIDAYCNSVRLSVKDRLLLFRVVCGAVHFAHQNLVVHRDIKPSNILVTDGGVPKLLDFGIAKLLSEEGGADQATQAGHGFMTIDYASPEQIQGRQITTISDVYSLGVLLYKLLTGRKPYGCGSDLPFEISQTILNGEPIRPGTQRIEIESSDDERRIRRMLTGDLSNIALMALRKDPRDRYQSVEQLSDDIRRFLDQAPVLASVDSRRYRFTKFVRRHRATVAAVAMIALSLLGGLLVSLHQIRLAREEKAKAENISAFLKQMLNYSNPVRGLPGKSVNETTINQVLDEAAKRIASDEFSAQPDVRAELEQILGESYADQGRYDLMERHMQSFISIEEQLYGVDNPRTLDAQATWAAILFRKGDLGGAEQMFRDILPGMRRALSDGAIKAEALTEALNNFAYLRRTQGDSREAEQLFREALAQEPLLPPEARYIVGVTRSTLASTEADQGKFDEALQTALQAVAESRRNGNGATPDLGFELTVLGGFLTEQGSDVQADSVLKEAEGIFRKLLSPTHLWLGDNLRNQAASLFQQGRSAEGLGKVTEALEIYRESFGTHYDHYPTALALEGLILDRMGRSAEGEQLLRAALKLRRDALPKGHFFTALIESALGDCLTTQKRYDEAEPLLQQSSADLHHSLGERDPRTILARKRLATLYRAWNKPEPVGQF